MGSAGASEVSGARLALADCREHPAEARMRYAPHRHDSHLAAEIGLHVRVGDEVGKVALLARGRRRGPRVTAFAMQESLTPRVDLAALDGLFDVTGRRV